MESTSTSHVIRPAASALACSSVSGRAYTPCHCHRLNSPCTVCQGPYSHGGSRHGTPSAPAIAHCASAAADPATCDSHSPQAATIPAPTIAHQKDPGAPHHDHHGASVDRSPDLKHGLEARDARALPSDGHANPGPSDPAERRAPQRGRPRLRISSASMVRVGSRRAVVTSAREPTR